MMIACTCSAKTMLGCHLQCHVPRRGRRGSACFITCHNCTCRKGFQQTLIVVDQLIGVFEAVGPDGTIDLDNAAQRESLDVIGRVGRSDVSDECPAVFIMISASRSEYVALDVQALTPTSRLSHR